MNLSFTTQNIPQMKFLLIPCVVLLFSCGNKKEHLIQVPEQTRITSEWILSELEEKAKEDPENDWLLNQQLYFCDQMEWPLRCERVLMQAKKQFGLSETLIDQFVKYHTKHENYAQLESILKGAVETRTRLEARVMIGLTKTPADVTLLQRYLDRFNDDRARLLAITGYLQVNDTTTAVQVIEKMLHSNPADTRLLSHYPLFARQGKIDRAIELLERLVLSEPENKGYRFDLAIYYHQSGRTKQANALLREINTSAANAQLHHWMKATNQQDSALYYLEKIADLSTNRDLSLSKAELLESTGRISKALAVYETVLAMDTTDFEMRQRVEIVRRKVAYLRQNWGKQQNPPSPTTKQETLGN